MLARTSSFFVMIIKYYCDRAVLISMVCSQHSLLGQREGNHFSDSCDAQHIALLGV